MLASNHMPQNIALQMVQAKSEKADISRLISDLKSRGWATLRHEIGDELEMVSTLKTIGSTLGGFAQGRAKSVEEVLQPQEAEKAHPRSLSAIYGTEQLPFHCELSHRRTPCRYLLLGCINPGVPASATLLVDWTNLELTDEEFKLLESAPILVRTGRRSFYSTLMPKDRRYLRYDPGCIEAIDKRGAAALRVLSNRLANAEVRRQNWRSGDVLLVDNWRILHGREPSTTGTTRRLARVLIDG